MNLEALIQIQATLDEITQAAKNALWKKTGKGAAMDEIEDEIRNAVARSSHRTGGWPDTTSQHMLDKFVKQRMGYMKKAFTKLNNPKTDVSQERAQLIGETETKAAKQFGKVLGYVQRGKKTFKYWHTDDPCEICADNEEEGAVPVGEEFPSGDFAPPAHPNCKCWLEFLDDDEDEE